MEIVSVFAPSNGKFTDYYLKKNTKHNIGMKYETLILQDVQVIGMSKEVAFNNPSECSKFWDEYVERIVKPVYIEGRTPDELSDNFK